MLAQGLHAVGIAAAGNAAAKRYIDAGHLGARPGLDDDVPGLARDVAAGLQRRPWGLAVALLLQAAVIVAGFVLVPALGVMGVVFAGVWAFLLWVRHDVARRQAAGELPAQQVREQ